MIEIRNPFVGMDGYRCFGCDPQHPFGFKLKFFLDKQNESIIAQWHPSEGYEGYSKIIHGGIQSALLDEVSAWAVYVLLKTAGFTARMQVRFHTPLEVVHGPVKLTAQIKEFKKGLATIESTLHNKNGELCSQGTLTFFVYPEEVAKAKFHYPGIEAFF